MIFWQLFLSFLKIGTFTFGGGYAMIALIQNTVVRQYGWLTAQEFTDLLAISQITPGPIGINTATFVGYMSVVNAGYSPLFGVLGAFLASFAVIIVPATLMILVLKFLQKHQANPLIEFVMKCLRLVVVGLLASAALLLVSTETFGVPGVNKQFIVSVAIFLTVFIASAKFKADPILLICVSGILGLLIY